MPRSFTLTPELIRTFRQTLSAGGFRKSRLSTNAESLVAYVVAQASRFMASSKYDYKLIVGRLFTGELNDIARDTLRDTYPVASAYSALVGPNQDKAARLLDLVVKEILVLSASKCSRVIGQRCVEATLQHDEELSHLFRVLQNVK